MASLRPRLWEAHQGQTVGTDALYTLAEKENLLPEVLGDGGERSQRTKLGKALGRVRDRIVAHYRIVSVGDDRRGRRVYRLEPAESPPTLCRRAPTWDANVGSTESQN